MPTVSRALVVVVSCVLAAPAGQQLWAQDPKTVPPISGLIAGQAVDAISARPVPDVAVTIVRADLARPTGNAGAISVLTDDQGHFVFRGIGPGRYMVVGLRNGYAESQAGALTADGPGQPLVVEPGGKIGDVTLGVWKLGVVAGTVTGDDGEPLAGVSVRALRRRIVSGRWRVGSPFTFEHSAKTNDLGEYRVSDLLPGSYVVVVEAPSVTVPAEVGRLADAERAANTALNRSPLLTALDRIGASFLAGGGARTFQRGDAWQQVSVEALAPTDRPDMTYATQFFPGAANVDAAQPLVIEAGRERTGVDFVMKAVRGVTVSGVIAGAGNAYLPVHLVRVARTETFTDLDTAATVTDGSGAFVLRGVLPGEYELTSRELPNRVRVASTAGTTTRVTTDASAPSDATYWLSLPVSVGEEDVRHLTASVNTGARVKGRVVFEGGSGPPASPDIEIMRADGRPLARSSDLATVRPSGGMFATPQLPPGDYILSPPLTVSVPRSADSWTLAGILVGGRDLGGRSFHVGSNDVSDVAVTYRRGPAGGVMGTVRVTGGDAMDGVSVLVFPADRALWVDYGGRSLRLQAVRPQRSGAFTVPDLPDGEYLVAAVAGGMVLDWQDPAFLALAAARAATVTVTGHQETIEVAAVRVSPDRRRVTDAAVPVMDSDGRRPHGPFAEEADGQGAARDGQRPVVSLGASTLAGVVTSADAMRSPVAHAVVTLTATEPRVGLSTVSDDAGRFAFTGLPAARYTLRATKARFLPAAFGATRPDRPGAAIALGANEAVTVALPMTRAAVVSGTVRDERGQPMRGVNVTAWRWSRTVEGEARLESVPGAAAPSDDRGAFRLSGLPPGDYLVAAARANVGFYPSLPRTTAVEWQEAQDLVAGRPGRPGRGGDDRPVLPADRISTGYVQMFFPSALAPDEATSIRVTAGDEKAGADITLRLIRFGRVRAIVTGPDGQAPPSVRARLVPRVTMPDDANSVLDAGLGGPVVNGIVDIRNVPPGEYVLHVGGSSVASPTPEGPFTVAFSTDRVLGLPLWALTPVTVGEDLVTATVQLEPALTVAGRIVFEGATPPPSFASLRPYLTGPRRGGLSLSTLFLPAKASGEFTFDGLIPAPYRLQLQAPRGWMVKSATINGRDAADLPVELTVDAADAVITLTDRVTQLAGALQTAGGASAVDYFVIAFPVDRAYWMPGARRIQAVRPGTNGEFIMNALPPGDYLLAAASDVKSGEWFVSEFLQSLVSTAISVSIADGERKRQDLRIGGLPPHLTPRNPYRRD